MPSPSVIAERDAAYREQLENRRRLDEFKKALDDDQKKMETTANHCRRVFADYKAEQKEAHDRRDSEEEVRGRHED